MSYLHGDRVNVFEDNVTGVLVIKDSGNGLGNPHPATYKKSEVRNTEIVILQYISNSKN